MSEPTQFASRSASTQRDVEGSIIRYVEKYPGCRVTDPPLQIAWATFYDVKQLIADGKITVTGEVPNRRLYPAAEK